jgi:RHS repeat-associated protein
MWTWNSDPFGTDAANANPAGVGTFAYNLRFPGQIFDGPAGLHQNGFRDYDPALGRYVESDPMGLLGGTNTYAYVEANPVSNYDPKGDFGWTGAAIGAGLDLGLQLIKNKGNFRCVDFGSVLISAATGAISPGITDLRNAMKLASAARIAIAGLENSLRGAETVEETWSIEQLIAHSEASIENSNTTMWQWGGAKAMNRISKILEAPTPLRFGSDCECRKQ